MEDSSASLDKTKSRKKKFRNGQS